MDVLFLSLLLVLVGATVWIWRRDRVRARRARVVPEAASPHGRLDAPTLTATLLAYLREHPELRSRIEHGNLFVDWRLEPSPAGVSGLPLETHSIEMRIDEAARTVHARYGKGAVEWWPSDDSTTLVPTVEWTWDMEPDFVPPPRPGETVDAPRPEDRHTMPGLVAPLRQRVLDAGWVWQPVLELPISESISDRLEPVR